MADFKVLGKNHVRVDAMDKVTGHATYAGDVYLPEMLMCKVLTSPRSHARIVSIDTSAAEGCPVFGASSPAGTSPTSSSAPAPCATAASWPATRFSTSASPWPRWPLMTR